MQHDVGAAILMELSSAEIIVKAQQNKKPQNLLDLLENDELDVLFNGADSLSQYKEVLSRLYERFKMELAELVQSCRDTFLDVLRQIKAKLSELYVLHNPKDQDLLLAHVVFKRNPRFVTQDYQLALIKKKCSDTSVSKESL